MTANYLAILPFIILAGGGITVYLCGALLPRLPKLLFILTFSAAMLCIAASAVMEPDAREFAGMIDISTFSRFYTILLAAICALTLLLLECYARSRNFANEVLYGTMLFATLGMIGIACATHWLGFFLSFELLSLSLYILIAIRRDQWQSYSKLHLDQDHEGKRATTRQYMEYGEEPHSEADSVQSPLEGDKVNV